MKIHILHTQTNKKSAQESPNSLSILDLTQLATLELLANDESCVILYQNPVELLAGLLRTGIELVPAITLYQNALNFLIGTFKAARPNVRLLAMDMDNAALEHELGEVYQAIESIQNSFCVNEQDLYDLATGFLLTQNRSLLKLSQQLAACSIVAFKDAVVDVALVLNNKFSEKQISAKVENELYEVKTQNISGLQQLDQVEAKLKVAEFKEIKLKEEVAKQIKLLGKKHKSKAKIKSELKETISENQQLITNFHQIQETLEKLEVDFSKLQSENTQKAKELEKKEVNLTSTKDILEKAQYLARESNSKLEEVSKENDQIIEQLHRVQETLEGCYLLEAKMKNEIITKNEEFGVQSGKLKAAKSALEKERASSIVSLTELKELETQHAVTVSEQQDMAKYNQWLSLLHNHAQKARYKVNLLYRGMLKKQSMLLQSSDLFDSEWYLSNYPNIRESGIYPALHYLQIGAAEGLNPSSRFNTLNYVFKYSDVAESGMNPLIHFLKYGVLEGREEDPRRKLLSGPTNQEQ
jgi:uncharacterized protein YigA (DUF484 family)